MLRPALVLFVLLAVPVFFFQKWRCGFEAPGARSGDEPHYLVLLHSIVKDGDLETANNYASHDYARGIYFANVPTAALDHHAMYVNKTDPRDFVRWESVYEFQVDPERPNDPAGFRFDKRAQYRDFDESRYREIGWHPPGYPMLLAAVSFPLVRANSYYVEAWIVLLQLLLYACAWIYAVREVRIAVTGNDSMLSGAPFAWTALLAVALPAYHYNAGFYTEGLASSLCLLVAAASLGRRPLELSLYLGLLFFVKESYAPFALLFTAAYALETIRNQRDLRIACYDILALVLFPLVAFAIFALRSYLIYGSPWQTYLPWQSNPEPLAAAAALLSGTKTGLLVFTPVVLVCLAGLFPLFRTRPVVALALAAAFIYQFALTAATVHWSGGPSFATRLLTPAVALVAPAFFAWRRSVRAAVSASLRESWFARALWIGTFALAALSGLNGFFGATHLSYAYDTVSYVNAVSPRQSHLYRRIKKELHE